MPVPGLSSHREGRGPQTARPRFRGVVWAAPEVTLAISHSCGQHHPPKAPQCPSVGIRALCLHLRTQAGHSAGGVCTPVACLSSGSPLWPMYGLSRLTRGPPKAPPLAPCSACPRSQRLRPSRHLLRGDAPAPWRRALPPSRAPSLALLPSPAPSRHLPPSQPAHGYDSQGGGRVGALRGATGTAGGRGFHRQRPARWCPALRSAEGGVGRRGRERAVLLAGPSEIPGVSSVTAWEPVCGLDPWDSPVNLVI